MYQTICQKCGAANHAQAIVCARCGVKLVHPELKPGAFMKRSGFVQSIVSAPGRFFKWMFRKVRTAVSMLFLLLLILGIGLYFFLFVPLSWGDYPMPAAEANYQALMQPLQCLRLSGGIFEADSAAIRDLGNVLIFNPDLGKRRFRQAPESLRRPDPVKGYFSFKKLPNDQFGMILYQRLYGKIPFCVMAVFTARRQQNGLLELTSCRIGNLPVPAKILRRAAEKILMQWNPDQQFLEAFDRILKAEMELRLDGNEEKITVVVQSGRN